MKHSNGFAYVHVQPHSFAYDPADGRVEATFEIATQHREGVLRCVRANLFNEHGEFMQENDGIVTLCLRPEGAGADEIVESAQRDTPVGNQRAIFGAVVYVVGVFKDGCYPIDSMEDGDS